MIDRPTAKVNREIQPLFNLIEKRFGISIPEGSQEHFRSVYEHYRDKKDMYLMQLGESGALASADYAKAVLISEAARMIILREIKPRPKKKK